MKGSRRSPNWHIRKHYKKTTIHTLHSSAKRRRITNISTSTRSQEKPQTQYIHLYIISLSIYSSHSSATVAVWDYRALGYHCEARRTEQSRRPPPLRSGSKRLTFPFLGSSPWLEPPANTMQWGGLGNREIDPSTSTITKQRYTLYNQVPGGVA